MKSISLSITLLLISVQPTTAYPRTTMTQTAPGMSSVTLMVKSEPGTLVSGSPCLFLVRSSHPLKSLAGRWQGRRVFFDFDATNRTWYGFAATGTETASGRHSLSLVATLANGSRVRTSFAVQTTKRTYPVIKLRVPDRFTRPNAAALAQIRRERVLKNRTFSLVTQNRLWHGRFVSPVEQMITEGFGVQRIFNRRRQSIHQGLDFRASTGTPIRAMNSGRVVIAHDMFYEGGFVVIDHGQGLMTLYMHLSQINANHGDSVRKGEIIGLSGASGRATGPHLHVGVRWQGIYLDPETLLALRP